MSSRGAVPPRWVDCPRNGELITNTFVPFKVPLCESFHSQLPPRSYFTPQMFIDYLRSQRLNVGLWIDLTNTNRYYERRDVTNEGIEYVKIRLRGHGECPDEESVNEFVGICEEFLSRSGAFQIAVHCTHGFNRTGFLICSYLVLTQKWTIESAIREFAKSRPPGIYKQEYIDELFRRFSRSESSLEAPPLPDWCNEDALYEEEDTHSSRSFHNRQPEASSSRASNNNTANVHHASHAEISRPHEGIHLVSDDHKIDQIQRICTRMCSFQKRGFPGTHPVSLTQDNINLLRENEYLVSWKADGTRYLLLIVGPNEMYFLDRDYRVYQLDKVTFLKKNSQEPLTNTLLDGELVVDMVDGKSYPRYLIYDIIYLDNQNVSGYYFRERLDFIYKHVFLPRENAKRTGAIDRTKEPIGIRMKDFCELKDTHKYFSSKFQRVLSHEIDGLIFQPVKCPYTPGRCDAILKWKPPSHNSVDFRLKINRERGPEDTDEYVGYLFVGGQSSPFSEIEVTEELLKYRNKIVECRFDMERQCWQFMRERTDKSFPNAVSTAMSVWKSMVATVTREYLLDFIQHMGQ